MKNYLKLFLILVSFSFGFYVAQAQAPEASSQEDTPENIKQAQEAVWKLVAHDNVRGGVFYYDIMTTFFIGPKHVVIPFLSLYSIRFMTDMYLVQGEKRLGLKVLYASVEDNLVILETNEEVDTFLNISKEEPSGRLVALGYSQDVQPTHRQTLQQVLQQDSLETLIHSKEYEVSNVNNGVYGYNMAVNKSNSKIRDGYPVLDEKGELIGVITASDREYNMLNIVKVSKLEELSKGFIGVDCSKILSLRVCVEKAIKNLEKRAEEGNRRAQEMLFLYLYSKVENKDEKKALLEKAAKQGFSIAQKELAIKYSEGKEVEPNEERAFELMEEAAEQGDAFAKVKVAFGYLEGEGVAPNKKKGFELMEEAAEQGYVIAVTRLAVMYSQGKVVNRNEEKAFELMKEAAAGLGFAPAQNSLGDRYYHAIGVKQNIEKAVKWWFESAEQNDPDGLLSVGDIYASGVGVEKDIKKAIEYYSRAVEKGNTKAQKYLDKLKQSSSCREIF